MRMLATCLTTIGLCAGAAHAGAQAPEATWEGLVKVEPRRLDSAALRPGADFRPYERVLLEPVVVSFREDWIRRANIGTPLASRVTRKDAERIAARAREIFADVFTRTFREAGFEIADSPGENVLRVRAGVIDLYLAAPDTNGTARTRTYTMESAEATLFVEAYDSTTGALLARGTDERRTLDTGRLELTNQVTNEADLRRLFGRWANTLAEGLRELQALSPVPDDLESGQRLEN